MECKIFCFVCLVLLVPEPDDLWFRVAFGPAGEVDSVP